MKRIIEILPMLAALLFVTACSNDTIEEIKEQPEGNFVKIPFAATVNDLTTTRATLDASKEYIFEAGDKLYVEGTGVYGILTLDDGEAGKKTGAKFSGALNCSGTPSADLALTATLVSTTDVIHTISGDKVTATSYGTAIASSEAEAVQKFSHFTGSATYGTPSFTLNQQSAFISFDVMLKDGTTTGSSVAVSISNGGAEVRSGSVNAVTVSSDVKARFVAAFPGGSTTLDNASVTLGTRPSISFGGSTALTKNKIYTVTKGLVDISTLTDAYEAKSGDLLYGIHNAGNISIADGATVTIKDATINKSYFAAGLTCVGDATINIEGTNDVTGYINDYPGIYIPKDKTLIIQGSGSLTATGGSSYAAGIGGSEILDCGNIVIKGGIITANGAVSQAGIGGGSGHSCGYISIEGGIITASGGLYGSGIGCGDSGSCGTITITSGVTQVKATAPDYRYIGAGSGGTCGTITIDGVAGATTSSSFTHFTSNVAGNTWTLTNSSAPAMSKAVTSLTTNEVGWRLGNDGKAYSAGTLPTGVIAEAVIAYVGNVPNYFSHFIAIALVDVVPSTTYYLWADALGKVGDFAAAHQITIGSTPYNTSTTGSTYYDQVQGNKSVSSATATAAQTGWRLPSITDWRYIFEGFGGPKVSDQAGVNGGSEMNYGNGEALYNAINTACGNTALSRLNYWTSSEYEGNSEYVWYYGFWDGITDIAKKAQGQYQVRAVFAY